jgi:hypothetical protein
MNRFLIYIAVLSTASCYTTKNSVQELGKVIIEKQSDLNSHIVLRGNIYELSTGDKLMLSDIWIGNKRYACDTNGHFQIKINSGKYIIEARAFGFKNYRHKLKIKKGDVFTLLYYLVPYKMEKPQKQMH